MSEGTVDRAKRSSANESDAIGLLMSLEAGDWCEGYKGCDAGDWREVCLATLPTTAALGTTHDTHRRAQWPLSGQESCGLFV